MHVIDDLHQTNFQDDFASKINKVNGEIQIGMFIMMLRDSIRDLSRRIEIFVIGPQKSSFWLLWQYGLEKALVRCRAKNKTCIFSVQLMQQSSAVGLKRQLAILKIVSNYYYLKI